MISQKKIKTYIISLKKDNAKLQDTLSLLSTHLDLLDIHVIEATNGYELSQIEIENYLSCTKEGILGPVMTPGEIGCCLSHHEVYRHIVNNNIRAALVLEDDVIPDVNFAPKLRILIDLIIKAPASVLLLQSSFTYYKDFSQNKEIVEPIDPLGTYGYLINIQAASLICSKFNECVYIADNWSLLRKSTGMLVLDVVDPIIHINSQLDSNILGSRDQKWKNFKKSYKYPLFLIAKVAPIKIFTYLKVFLGCYHKKS